MNKMPLPIVSVIMPAYNASAFIEEAIQSVLNQDLANIELIVVDDGSSDGTPELAARFGDKVKVLRQKNAGPAAARNRGVAAAQGEFIAFLDADDVWLPRKLALQVQFLRNYPDVGVVYGTFLRWHSLPDGSFSEPPEPIHMDKQFDTIPEHSGWVYKTLLFDNVIHIITAMVRRSVFESIGGLDESLATGEDYDFWLKVSQQFRVAKFIRTLAYYRMHADSITKVPRKENNEYNVLLRTLEAYGPKGPDGVAASEIALRERLFKLCFSHGYFHIRSGDSKVAQEAFSAALRHAPISPKVWGYWLLAAAKRLTQ